jgi:glycerol-3-phosphate dehydrogenase
MKRRRCGENGGAGPDARGKTARYILQRRISSARKNAKENEMEKYDVVIIGGGVVGCATARELTRYKLRVAVLEGAADICDGQSKANTAIVHAGYDAKPGTNKAHFNVLGNGMFDRITQELDVPFERNGSLVVAFSEEGIPALNALVWRGESNGVKNLRVVNREELREMEPNIGADAVAALWAPTGGIVCPYELTIAYAENAVKNGAVILRGTPVDGIARRGDGYVVRSGKREFFARAVVNCAGVHADEINNMVSAEKQRIAPRRGEYYIVDKNYGGLFRSAIFQLPTAMGKGVLVARTVEDTILLGPTAEDIPDKEDKATTAQGLAKVLAHAAKTWEDIPRRGFITTFSGIRAHCDRDDFVLGEPGDAPFFFNALGVESPGLTSAPAIAVYLAESVVQRLRASENPAFDPIRKGIPKFRTMDAAERARAIAENPDYAKIVCRCENVTEAEIRESIRRPVGARSVDGVKFRTRAGMGRCQSGFCLTRVMEILSEELGVPVTEITKNGGGSKLVVGGIFEDTEGDGRA